MVKYELGYVKGADGRGIVSIEKTGTSGLIDTYTITYSDGTTTTFVVKNGEDGSAITIDTALSSSSTNSVQNKIIKTALDSKSDSSHNHDSRYYTETEMDTKLSSKANTTHTHNISDVSNLQSALDGKADDSDIPTETSDLTNDGDGTNPFLTQHQSLASKTVTVEKQATADTGYFATYVVKQNGSQVGSKINIPKDYLVKSGSVKTCTTADVPVQGYVVGDKYIDFVVNTRDGSGTDEHFYILVSDLVDVPVAWSDITGKPSSFTPSSHSHSISDVSNLQSSLDGKADTGHTHTKSNITDFAHTHDDRYYTETETDNLLSGKAASSHTHLTSSTDILTEESYPNIGVSSGDKLITVFNAIDTKIGDLEDLIGDAITYINGSGS